jgi:predicted NAD/FAD-dependent oxidoreductase
MASASATARTALVVGGGFAGLAAAEVLAQAGTHVFLAEQGRGLGGRVCTRTAQLPDGNTVTFDHGALASGSRLHTAIMSRQLVLTLLLALLVRMTTQCKALDGMQGAHAAA